MTARTQDPNPRGGDDVPEELHRVIAKATAPQAKDRHQSVAELEAGLEDVLRQMPDVPSLPYAPSPPTDDRTVPMWILPVGVLGMLFLAALAAHLGLI